MIEFVEQSRRARRRGFTLLELVLVMLIACTALAMAAPSLRNWRKGSELRGSVDQFLTLTRLARTEAISKGRIYRIEFDEQLKYQLKMQEGTHFIEVPGDFGRVHSLPEGTRLEIHKEQVANEYQQSDARVIDFYPTGRTQPLTLSLTDSQNYEVVVQCATPAGGFKFVSGGLKQ